MNRIPRKLIECWDGVFDFIRFFENSIELLHKQRGLTKDMIIVRKQRKPRDWETERFQESIFLLWFKRPLFHRWHQLKERLSQTRAACAGWQMAFYFNLRKRNPNQSDQHNWSDSERAEPARTLLESNIFYWYCINTRGDEGSFIRVRWPMILKIGLTGK